MEIKKPNIIEYMEYLRSKGYSKENIYIDETYTDIITRLSLAKGAVGTVIDVRCPPSYKMVVVGSSQLQQYRPFSAKESCKHFSAEADQCFARLTPTNKADHEDAVQLQQQGAVLLEEYDTEVSSIMIRLANAENIEIDPDVRIKIIKEKVSQSISIIDTMFYKDISATAYTKTSENETKQLEEQYVFDKGIEINGGEHLKIEAVHPNVCVDASNIRLSLGLDLWEQE